MHIIGQTGHGILCVAVHKLRLRATACDLSQIDCPFSQICCRDFSHDPDAVLVPWGFPITADSSVSTQVQEYFMKGRGFEEHEHLCFYDHLNKVIRDLAALVEPSFDHHLQSFALHIANTCVVEPSHIAEFGFDRAFPSVDLDSLATDVIYSLDTFDSSTWGVYWLLIALWNGGILVLDHFMSMSYGSRKASKDRSHPHQIEVAVYANHGQVIFPKALLDFSTDLRDVLALIVIPGNLEWKGVKYKLLNDFLSLDRSGPMTWGKPAYYNFFSSDNKFVHPQTDQRGNYEVSLPVALGSAVLFLRVEVVNITNGNRVQYSILEAQRDLSRAFRPRKSEKSLAALEKEFRLNSILVKQRDLLGRPFPESHHHNPTVESRNPVQDPGTRTILTYTGDPAVDFSRACAVRQRCPLVLQGDASILECIMQAEERFGSEWTILAEP